MNYQPGGAKPAPPLPPALLMLGVFAMKAQARSRVSDLSQASRCLGLMCHIWGQGRGCAICAMAGKRGKVPFPRILCCGQPRPAVPLQEAAVGAVKNVHMCTQTPRQRGLLWEWPESKWIWASTTSPRPASAGLK